MRREGGREGGICIWPAMREAGDRGGLRELHHHLTAALHSAFRAPLGRQKHCAYRYVRAA